MADEEGMSSSGSLDRLRPPPVRPRFAADMLGLSGELCLVSNTSFKKEEESQPHGSMYGYGCQVIDCRTGCREKGLGGEKRCRVVGRV